MGLIRTMFTVAALGATGLGGWLAGSFYPAPDSLKDLVGQRAKAISGLDPAQLDWAKLVETLPASSLAQLRQQASQSAAQAGEAILIEHSTPQQLAEQAETAPMPLPLPALAPVDKVDAGGPLVCARMTVSNAPRPGNSGPRVSVQGVRLLLDPTADSCLSSGYGPRNGRPHRGLDYYNANGGAVLAAGDGTIIEKKYRDDFGNMLLIDHGGGVFTRYAHLAGFDPLVRQGGMVKEGQMLGLMGNTAAYRIPVHLHYEVLVGDYANPKASFGLEAKDPFSFPKAE